MGKSTRVYELATAMGMAKQELVDLINGSKLGFSVKDSMSSLNEVQEKAVQQAVAIQRSSQSASAIDARSQSTAHRVSSGVRIRRRQNEDVKAEELSAQPNEPVGLDALRASKPSAPKPAQATDAGSGVKESPETRERVEPAVQKAKDADVVLKAAAVEASQEALGQHEDVGAQSSASDEQHSGDDSGAEEPSQTSEQAKEKKSKDSKAVKAKAKEALVIEIQPKFEKELEVSLVSEPLEEEVVETSSEDEPEFEAVEGEKEIPKVAGKKKVVRPEPDAGSAITGYIDPAIIRARLDKDNKRFSGDGARAKAPKSTVGRTILNPKDIYSGQQHKGSSHTQSPASGKSNKRGAKQAPLAKPVPTVAAEHKRVIRISEIISISDLAKELGVKSAEVIQFLMKNLGVMMTVNQTLDFDTAELVAAEYNHTVQNVAFKEEDFIESAQDKPEDLQLRAPVVTVMGHVDHGKTSLLDAIRNSRVTSSEAGGITQHIGASSIDTANGKVVFLDTPGHEAFTALRARGAKVTDLVVLVVAADDGVMPQTVEAINHAKAAGAPIIVAVNKIDKQSANPERVKQALTEYSLIPEEWGGSTIFKEVSALTGEGIQELLELIQLQSEVLELKANPDKEARGIMLEAYKDNRRGTIATMIIQEGTLRLNDIIVSGACYGKVKTMVNDKGKSIRVAGPATPVEITGLSDVPDAGEPFFVTKEEKIAKEFTQQIRDRKRNAELKSRKFDPWAAFKENKQLNVIIKSDVQGSLEALEQSLKGLTTSEVELIVVHSAVGGATESDLQLAIASNAFIIGFNTRPEARAADIAKREGIGLESFSVIYDVIDRVKEMMSGLLDPIYNDNTLGHVEIRDTFSVPRVGTIAGGYVLDGKIIRNAKCRLVRQGKVIYDSKVASLKRFKDDAKEVRSGFECGFSIENYNDIKVGDIVEVYEVIESKATL